MRNELKRFIRLDIKDYRHIIKYMKSRFMVPYSDLSGYITCGETVEINSLDARIWLEIVLEDVENYEQDSFEDYSGQLKLSFRKKCRDDENKFIVHKK